MARRRAFLALVLVVLACSGPGAQQGTIVLVDDAGDTLRLARPAARVVSLIPTTTELLFALGAGAQVVGRTAWCDWPPEALQVPNLGDGIEPNIELVVSTRPDLVVLYRSARNAEAAARLRGLGIAAVQLRTDLLEDLERSTVLLGNATGHSAEANAQVDRLREELAESRASRPSGLRVLILAWDQPPMVIGRGSFLHQIVEMAGGRNLFDDLAASAAPVSLEAIAVRDPDVILTTAETPAFLERPEWRVIRAVRERKLIHVHGSEFHRPTPRAPSAVRRLAAAFDSSSAK